MRLWYTDKATSEWPAVATDPFEGSMNGFGSYSLGRGNDVDEAIASSVGRDGNKSTDACVRRRLVGIKVLRTRETREEFAHPLLLTNTISGCRLFTVVWCLALLSRLIRQIEKRMIRATKTQAPITAPTITPVRTDGGCVTSAFGVAVAGFVTVDRGEDASMQSDLSVHPTTFMSELPPFRPLTSVITNATEVPPAIFAIQSKLLGPTGGNNSKACPRGINP